MIRATDSGTTSDPPPKTNKGKPSKMVGARKTVRAVQAYQDEPSKKRGIDAALPNGILSNKGWARDVA